MKTIQELLQQLETAKDILSKFQLGYLYDKGELVPQDAVKAFKYYQQASEMEEQDQNSLDIKYKGLAIYNVGVMYFYGRGVQENKQQALELVQKAAETGVIEANWRLGQMYQHGEGVSQNTEEAYEHYLLAANQGHAAAQFELGKMYFKGLLLGTAEKSSNVIAKEYFQKAEKNSYADVKYFLQDWVSVWPSEDWNFVDVLKYKHFLKLENNLSFAPNIEPLNGSKHKQAIREELLGLIDETKRSFLSKDQKEFSFEDLMKTYSLRFTTPLDKKTISWLRMLVEFGLDEGHYAIGHYYLQEMHRHSVKIKKLFHDLKSCYWDIVDDHINDVKTYFHCIAMYIITKSSLERALKGGIQKARQDLDELKEYKQYLEYEGQWTSKKNLIFWVDTESLSTIHALSTYIQLVTQDDGFFEQIQTIVEAITQFNNKNREQVQFCIPAKNLESLLLKCINNNDFNEYKIWVALLLDKQQVLRFNTLFFEHAIEAGRTDILQELLSLESFDVNCIITKLNITPLEFFIEQGDLVVVEKLLQRQDLDINFRYPLLKAVEENQSEIVILMLTHSGIDVNVTKNKGLGGPTSLWLAAKYGYADIVRELLYNPKIYVDCQCRQLNEKEKASLSMGREKMNVQEVAMFYGHQEVVDIIKEYKKLRAAKMADRKRQNVNATYTEEQHEGIQTTTNSRCQSTNVPIPGNNVLFFSTRPESSTTVSSNQTTDLTDIDGDVPELEPKRKKNNQSL